MACDHIYTRRGDKGDTGLLGGGQWVRKDCLRLEACGTVDELISWLGLVVVEMGRVDLAEALRGIQGNLLEIGACLAGTEAAAKAHELRAPGQEAVKELESMIDCLSADLPSQTCLLLPGGSRTSSMVHIARTVCRRAERRVVSLREHSALPSLEQVLIYLNRLSDYLYVLARTCNQIDGVPETPWHRDGSSVLSHK